MRYTVYVDGFNLYYGCLKRSKYKWLNIENLVQELGIENISSLRIRYFTAKLLNSESDQSITQRQEVYLRALKTIPDLTLHMGQFKEREVKGRLIREEERMPNCKLNNQLVEVKKFEEKGSDVNIASYIIRDAYEDECDGVILISNDSDLVAPLRIVKSLEKRVVLVSPQRFHMDELKKYSDVRINIKTKHLREGQFETSLVDKLGRFDKPDSWS